MSDSGSDALHQVQNYRKIVLLYEALDSEIDGLIMKYGGTSHQMPPEALARYRELARRRDEVLNEMRALERQLHIDEDS